MKVDLYRPGNAFSLPEEPELSGLNLLFHRFQQNNVPNPREIQHGLFAWVTSVKKGIVVGSLKSLDKNHRAQNSAPRNSQSLPPLQHPQHLRGDSQGLTLAPSPVNAIMWFRQFKVWLLSWMSLGRVSRPHTTEIQISQKHSPFSVLHNKSASLEEMLSQCLHIMHKTPMSHVSGAKVILQISVMVKCQNTWKDNLLYTHTIVRNKRGQSLENQHFSWKKTDKLLFQIADLCCCYKTSLNEAFPSAVQLQQRGYCKLTQFNHRGTRYAFLHSHHCKRRQQ